MLRQQQRSFGIVEAIDELLLCALLASTEPGKASFAQIGPCVGEPEIMSQKNM